VPRGLFVTGTDTGVGKTVVSAALLHRYRHQARLRYWKPVQTGIEEDDDTAAVAALAACAPGEIVREGVRLPRPLSPHAAAALAGVTIETTALLAAAARHADAGLVIEGAGGVLVPLNGTDTMATLMTRLGLPVLVVARSSLGTINHTLLTLDALRARQLAVAGVVMVGARNESNRAAIEHYGGTTVLGELPWLDPLTPAALEVWATSRLDPGGLLGSVWA